MTRTEFVAKAIAAYPDWPVDRVISHAREQSLVQRDLAEDAAGVLRAGQAGGWTSWELYGAERRMCEALHRSMRARAVVIALA